MSVDDCAGENISLYLEESIFTIPVRGIGGSSVNWRSRIGYLIERVSDSRRIRKEKSNSDLHVLLIIVSVYFVTLTSRYARIPMKSMIRKSKFNGRKQRD